MANVLFKLRKFVQRYGVSILFPVLTFSAIYADYSRTQAWKAKKQAVALASSSQLQ